MKKIIVIINLLVAGISYAQDTSIIVNKVNAVNSTADELMPVFTHNGKIMYIVRGFHPENTGGENAGQDIWKSTMNDKDSSWSTPIRLNAPLNNVQDNSVCGISQDGKTIYLDNIYDKKGNMHPGLSTSVLNDKGIWEKPKEVEIIDFDPQPPFLEFSFPESDPNVMIISQEHEDTSRKEDLYVSLKGAEGVWSKPQHMGDVINTKGYDISPFLARDGKTLYFATNGYKGGNDCDIYKSTRLDNSWTNWSKPVALGEEINTDGFEAYFVIDAFGREYFVRGENNVGNNDIYTITYKITMPPVVEEPVIDTTPVVVEKEPELEPVPPFDKSYKVLFDYNMSKINAKAQPELEKVIAALKEDPSRKVSVEAHTCDVGSSDYNTKLARRRENSVVDYLIAKGVSKDRIASNSYGNNKPAVENDSDENRALNRRAEIRVFEEEAK